MPVGQIRRWERALKRTFPFVWDGLRLSSLNLHGSMATTHHYPFLGWITILPISESQTLSSMRLDVTQPQTKGPAYLVAEQPARQWRREDTPGSAPERGNVPILATGTAVEPVVRPESTSPHHLRDTLIGIL